LIYHSSLSLQTVYVKLFVDSAILGKKFSRSAPQARLWCVYRANTSEPRIWLSGTLVFKRKFIKVKHQNLEAVLEGVA